MRFKITYILLLTIINFSSLGFTKSMVKKTCPKVIGLELYVCPTDYHGYCIYFAGEGCDSNLCARLTANSCTACSDRESVVYYTESVCKANKVFCDDYARPEDCPKQSNPVCAYYASDACPGGVCSQTAGSPCHACGNQFVEYYKPGKCPKPTQYTCDFKNTGCNKITGPVCAFFTEGCPLELCSRTVSSATKACHDSTILYYKPGKCVDEISSCSKIDISQPCSLDYHPVCASLTKCDYPDCQRATKTFDNACQACAASGYEYYSPGVCPLDKWECPREDIIKYMPKDGGPVCAFFDGLSQTYDNSYLACSQSTPDYYIEGPCSFNCDEVWTKWIRIPCIGLPVNPVCGYYTEGCSDPSGICQESFTNSCYGCSTGKLGKFTDGLCPGNSSIFCEPDISPGSCAITSPACAIYEEGCDDESCRKTFQNPCQVCQDSAVFSYTPGLCPGDKGVPCDEENRPSAEDCANIVTGGPVCGASGEDCSDNSCRRSYDNSCLACADPMVLYYNDRECSA